MTLSAKVSIFLDHRERYCANNGARLISIVDKIWINYSATFLMLSVKENRGSCIFEYLLIIIRILIEWFFDSIILK